MTTLHSAEPTAVTTREPAPARAGNPPYAGSWTQLMINVQMAAEEVASAEAAHTAAEEAYRALLRDVVYPEPPAILLVHSAEITLVIDGEDRKVPQVTIELSSVEDIVARHNGDTAAAQPMLLALSNYEDACAEHEKAVGLEDALNAEGDADKVSKQANADHRDAIMAACSFPTADPVKLAQKRALLQGDLDWYSDEREAILDATMAALSGASPQDDRRRAAWDAAVAARDAANAAYDDFEGPDPEAHELSCAVGRAQYALEMTPTPDIWDLVAKFEHELEHRAGAYHAVDGFRRRYCKTFFEPPLTSDLDDDEIILLRLYVDTKRIAIDGPGLTPERWLAAYLSHGGSVHRHASFAPDGAPWLGWPWPGDAVFEALMARLEGKMRLDVVRLLKALPAQPWDPDDEVIKVNVDTPHLDRTR